MTPQRTVGAASTTVVWRWTRFTPDAPARARIALRCALGQLGYDSDRAVTNDVVLAVSEFVANAIEHAVGPYEMRLRHISSGVICEVVDHEPRIPKIPPVSTTASCCAEADCTCGLDLGNFLLPEAGRGLQIVDELTGGAWGFRSWREGKAAWLVLPASRCD